MESTSTSAFAVLLPYKSTYTYKLILHIYSKRRQVEKPSLASTAFTCLHLYIFGIYLVHVQVEAFLPVEKPSLGVIFCHANSQIYTQRRKILFLGSTTISENLDRRKLDRSCLDVNFLFSIEQYQLISSTELNNFSKIDQKWFTGKVFCILNL